MAETAKRKISFGGVWREAREMVWAHRGRMAIGLAAGIGTVVQAASSFSLSLLLGAAAQRSIHDLRLKVQSHIGRLPIKYFEDHKSGELISRIMSDAEGVRNLV